MCPKISRRSAPGSHQKQSKRPKFSRRDAPEPCKWCKKAQILPTLRAGRLTTRFPHTCLYSPVLQPGPNHHPPTPHHAASYPPSACNPNESNRRSRVAHVVACDSGMRSVHRHTCRWSCSVARAAQRRGSAPLGAETSRKLRTAWLAALRWTPRAQNIAEPPCGWRRLEGMPQWSRGSSRPTHD